MIAIVGCMRVAVAALALAAAGAQAGGPLSVCNSTPVKYPGNGTVNLSYDKGALGTRTKAQADAIVTSAVSLWTNVPTATVTIGRAADLPVDVTTANFTTYDQKFSDGINPVIYDTDGTIVDLLLGTNSRNSVLGFAGSAWSGGATCAYTEGQAVINGFLSVSDATLSTVMAHEIGHLIGMDHTQLDSSQGLASSNYPLMYPIAYRSSVSLHEDDVAAVSALYPGATLNTIYGQLTGTFVQANGVTPVLGANLWATETTTGKVYSIVSDYLTQGTGYFKLLLPAGTYNLRAEAIQSGFTGGSGVGPYSDTVADASFQAPLYTGSTSSTAGTPMAPVTLGNATPAAFAITPGCAATLTFRISGTGTVGGNCGATVPATAAMASPAPGSTLTGATQTFTWNNTGASSYQVWVGNSVGTYDIGYAPNPATTATSATLGGIPTDGRTLYVRLWSNLSGTWQARDYTYKASGTAAVASGAAISSPAPGSTLAGPTQAFTWNNSGATSYQVWVGTTPGTYDIGYAPNPATTATSATIGGIPTDGRTLYVRLWSNLSGVWQARDYTYKAAGNAAVAVAAAISSPAPGSTLGGSTQAFTWNSSGAGVVYQLWVGTSPGTYDITYSPTAANSATSATIGGLPTDGRTLYVRLWSNMSGVWQARDYTYKASGTATAATAAAILTPAPGTTLSGSIQTFTWNNSGASSYQVWVGNTYGSYDVGYFPTTPTTATSTTVSGLPTDGRTLFVRMYSNIGGVWFGRDYTYRAGP